MGAIHVPARAAALDLHAGEPANDVFATPAAVPVAERPTPPVASSPQPVATRLYPK